MEGKIGIVMPVPHSFSIPIPVSRFCYEMEKRHGALLFQMKSYEGAYARNIGIDILKKSVDYFFFLDADTCPQDNAVEKLLGHDRDFIGGVTPIIGMSPNGIVRKWNVAVDNPDSLLDYDKLPEELFEVNRIGGTTILVKRNVIETIGWPYFKLIHKEGNKRESAEWYFSQRVIDSGFKIWVDPSVKCGHYQYVNLLEVFEGK